MATRKIISKEVKHLLRHLRAIRATQRHPLVLKNPVTVTQTIDGRGFLDFASITVRKVWHDRTTVVIEDGDGTTARLVDTYETDPSGYYMDSWWNTAPLAKELLSGMR